MSLRDAIADKHNAAEKHCFVVLLLSGNMPQEIYAEYLLNQAICYHALETKADEHHLLDDLTGLHRAALIKRDAYELNCGSAVHESTKRYVEYLESVTPTQLWAHIYVRHFADMYGGQMIKKVAPGSCHMYEFEDRAGLIAKIRPKLANDLADEANRVFDFALSLFDEVAEAHAILAHHEKEPI